MWEKLMAEDAAAEKQVAIGSVGWEIFALEKEIKKKPKMRDLVDSSDEEDEDEKEIEDDSSDEEDKEVTDKLWVEVVKKGIKEKTVNEKGFKENVFAVDYKGFNKKGFGANKNWETKNRFEKFKDDEDKFETQQKTELNFGNMMKNRMNKGLVLMKPKIKAKETEVNLECRGCNGIEFSRSGEKTEGKEINNVDKSAKVRRKGKVTVDSGAEDSVWPATHVDWDKVVETEESRNGIGFVAANGSRMVNYGGTKVEFVKEGKRKCMNFQVTDCKKPLASVSKIVDKGNRVVFDSEGSFIENKLTGEIMKLERERGTYVMVVEYETSEEVAKESGFTRQS